MNDYVERSFEELASEISESFQFFDSQQGGLGDYGGSADIAVQAKYLGELLRTFKPKKSQLDLFSLFDANKPYTRNVICDSRRFQLVLYCWNPGAASKIHDHPCDFCLVVPLSGALKIERFEPGRVLVRNQVRFLLEGSGQVAFLTNNDGLFKFTNPRRYVNMISLSLLTPPYRSHTTWVTPESQPELTRIGTFSIRGIRTPRLEARLSPHGLLLAELKEKATLIPAGANLKPHGKRRDNYSVATAATGGASASAADGGGGVRAAAAFSSAGSVPASPERRISESARGVDSKTGKVTIQTRSGDVFSLGESVGKGAFGSVFQAFSKITGNFAAVKVISAPSDDAESAKHVQNIVTEITLLQSCEHPNIVRYIDAVKTSDNFYIVTEFMESRSIAHILSSFGPLEESLARNYMQQILMGLSYLHERQVVHRDVKGANILVNKDGLVKLADFGIALQLRENEEELKGEVVGSPYWMAPEIVVQSPVTAKSDVWSAACTAVEMVQGSPPYYELSPLRAFYRIVNDPHPPLPLQTSSQLQDFLLRCFCRDPLARPSTAELLVDAEWVRLET